MMMSEIFELEGNISAACEVIQDVHVETYGSISKVDKVYYIIEQVSTSASQAGSSPPTHIRLASPP